MQTHFLLIFVLTTIAVAAIAASRSKLPPAIVMVLVGLVLAVTPGLPQVEIAPERDSPSDLWWGVVGDLPGAVATR
jgi:Kef-type K+ transport system membrane component KefB